ncbi:hypothetical protein DXH47_05625 [Levilactobacillus suantsaii]|uniref:Uncharacterized protein n=1 Tax=Levilactobacillus suantsaii TaxID=2292255 RepID=A0A4V1LFD6_9LACO|nr:hypothetical protein DXH47_05625 [Levilactobacillus suantsaii]
MQRHQLVMVLLTRLKLIQVMLLVIILPFTETVLPGEALPETVMPGEVLPETIMPGEVLPETIMPGEALPETITPGEALPLIKLSPLSLVN